MPFRLPSFNLNVNIWRMGTVVANPPDVVSLGNLSPGRRVGYSTSQAVTSIAFGANQQNQWVELFNPVMELLLPGLTDVQTADVAQRVGDCVEVPAGSGRYYFVVGVDDVAKGFPNEYRIAWLIRLTPAMITITGNPWVVPFPSWPMP